MADKYDLIGHHVSFNSKNRLGIVEKLSGTVIQAFVIDEATMKVQVELDGTKEKRWYKIHIHNKKDAPNAPKFYPCDNCGRMVKRHFFMMRGGQ